MTNMRSTGLIAIGILCIILLSYNSVEAQSNITTEGPTTAPPKTTAKPSGAGTTLVSVPLMVMTFFAARKFFS